MRHPVVRFVLPTLGLALLAALLAQSIGLPLPWMIGPLFAVAGARMAGLRLQPLAGGRQAGQWAIGTALGLYFSPAVLGQLAEHALLLAAAALASLALGGVCALLTLRLARVDAATAFFASLPGGASEMANLAERWGGAVDRIAAAHALRIMLLVSLVPLGLTLSGAHGSDIYIPQSHRFDLARLPLLIAASLAGVGVLRLLRIANAWVLGPLLGVGVLSALTVPLSALPGWAVNGGQLLIGCSLGSRFSREFFRAAPRFIGTTALSALLSILLGLLLSLLLAHFSGVPLATLVLATAPGGVAEMCITAKVLQLGVPLVTAAHVLRVVVLTLGAQFAFGLFRRRFAP
ncbi:AbrB family transcriptional regulator [Azonexus caeni]|jgi:membrane AbrB-like protein|uniref:AbrB family transcriptional regulator n=1 Tax=Azonexus caeni TaxID=266126 RepID=UPI003A878559